MTIRANNYLIPLNLPHYLLLLRLLLLLCITLYWTGYICILYRIYIKVIKINIKLPWESLKLHIELGAILPSTLGSTRQFYLKNEAVVRLQKSLGKWLLIWIIECRKLLIENELNYKWYWIYSFYNLKRIYYHYHGRGHVFFKNPWPFFYATINNHSNKWSKCKHTADVANYKFERSWACCCWTMAVNIRNKLQ
jgi:hypothetical protein